MPEVLIPESTVAFVTNLSDKAFKAKWANVEYKIAPGETGTVPYFGACMWFGDPRAVNIGDPDADFDKQPRTHAYRHLSALYGTQNDSWFIPLDEHPDTSNPPTVSDPHWGDPRTNPQNKPAPAYVLRGDKWWHPNLPYVEVYSDYGRTQRTITVIDDPWGENVTPAEAHTKAEADLIAGQIAAMQNQIAQLQLEAAVKAQGAQMSPDFDLEDSVTSGPSVTPDESVPDDALPADDEAGTQPKPRPGRPRRPLAE